MRGSDEHGFDSDALVLRSKASVESAVGAALECAQQALSRGVRYVWGAKSDDAVDCSGLMTLSYGTLLPDGADRQAMHLRPWVLDCGDFHLAEAGDLVFFSMLASPAAISHVAIVSGSRPGIRSLIHASGRAGHVISDSVEAHARLFRDDYLVSGIGKMRPWLFRQFVEIEVRKGQRGNPAGS